MPLRDFSSVWKLHRAQALLCHCGVSKFQTTPALVDDVVAPKTDAAHSTISHLKTENISPIIKTLQTIKTNASASYVQLEKNHAKLKNPISKIGLAMPGK